MKDDAVRWHSNVRTAQNGSSLLTMVKVAREKSDYAYVYADAYDQNKTKLR